MAAAVVLQVEIEVREFQRRRAALLVLPGDRGITHDDPVLRQQPIGKIAVLGLAGKCQAGDEDAALRVTADG